MSGQLDGFTTNLTPSGQPTQGFDVHTQYEFIPKTYVQYRLDDLISNSTTRNGILIGYAPSEFSVLRLQLDRSVDSNSVVNNRILAQANFTIGFHPAHDY
jgi:hypothetical protein